MDIHKREDYDIEFIQSLIDNGIEESINIDFKASGALSKEEMKKKESFKILPCPLVRNFFYI